MRKRDRMREVFVETMGSHSCRKNKKCSEATLAVAKSVKHHEKGPLGSCSSTDASPISRCSIRWLEKSKP